MVSGTSVWCVYGCPVRVQQQCSLTLTTTDYFAVGEEATNAFRFEQAERGARVSTLTPMCAI